MKFDYLREFVAAAESEEMQIAAKELSISPSVLSKHIKSIEQELGVPLFLRSRKTQLTPYGKCLLPYARELVKVQDDYLQDLQEHPTAERPRLTIGLSTIQFRERSGQLVENFVQQHPQDVQLREADNAVLCQMVASGEIDMAFVRTQAEMRRNPELVYIPFCTDSMVAFLPLEHPLAQRKSVTFEDLKDEHIILRAEKTSIAQLVKAKFAELGITPNISYCNSYFISYDLMRRGEGITLYLATPASANRSNNQIAYVPVYPPITSFIDVVFRPRHLPQIGVELLQQVHQTAIEWYRSSDEGT